MLIMKQAKIYHEELKIEGNCEYSTGWLPKFKKRHGIKFVKICHDKTSGDHKAVDQCVEEVDLDKDFNPDCQTRAIHSLTGGELAKAFLNQQDCCKDAHEDGVGDTGAQMPIDDMVKMCDELIEGLEQHAFITEQEIMSVYKIKERLLRQKLLLTRQMTLEGTV